MPHKDGCQCPACRYRRGEGKGQAPQITVRFAPEIMAWVRAQTEGARAYIEGLIRRDMAQPRDGGQAKD